MLTNGTRSTQTEPMKMVWEKKVVSFLLLFFKVIVTMVAMYFRRCCSSHDCIQSHRIVFSIMIWTTWLNACIFILTNDRTKKFLSQEIMLEVLCIFMYKCTCGFIPRIYVNSVGSERKKEKCRKRTITHSWCCIWQLSFFSSVNSLRLYILIIRPVLFFLLSKLSFNRYRHSWRQPY